MVGQSAARVQAILLKVTLLILGLHCGFTVSYLDLPVSTEALLPMDRCQIVVVEWGYDEGYLIWPSC